MLPFAYSCIISVIFISIASYEIVSEGSQSEDESPKDFSQKVEVRAVFINCASEDDSNPTDSSDLSRFQRQELFKHNSLKKCAKKLALTIRMTADPAREAAAEDESKAPNDDSSGDEYIPVDHVFEGSNKKRVRLLNPYILRLRRESAVQAYKLRKIDTVSGILTGSKKDNKHTKQKRESDQRELSAADAWAEQLDSESAAITLEHDAPRNSYSVRVGTLKDLQPQQIILDGPYSKPVSKDCGLRLFEDPAPNDVSQNPTFPGFEQKNDQTPIGKVKRLLEKRVMCLRQNQTWIRDKRHKLKYIPETYGHEKIKSKDHYLRSKDHQPRHQRFDKSPRRDHASADVDIDEDYQESKPHYQNSHSKRTTDDAFENQYITPKDVDNTDERSEPKAPGRPHGSANARNFALYEIGNPKLWYSVHVNLFEKMSTPQGKTVWNDLTSGKPARLALFALICGGSYMCARLLGSFWF